MLIEFNMLRKTSEEQPAPCLVLCGPATCGKTSLAKLIEKQTGCNRLEGDDYHSEKWKRKPYPLSDEERDEWIAKLIRAIHQSLDEHPMTVATCSALTHRVQSRLLAISSVMLIYLDISLETALRRATWRKASGDHWFHEEDLIRDQFHMLKLPEPQEQVVILPADNPSIRSVASVLDLANWKR